MGWQDRDYAQHTPVRPVLRPGGVLGGGRSIVTTLIVVNTVIYLVGSFFPGMDVFLSGGQRIGRGGLELIAGIGELRADLVMRGQVWRLITAQYLHASLGHVFVNMLVLHFLGRPLERLWSARRFLTIYTISGLFGNLFFTVLASRGVIPIWMPAVGASGCIYGLLGIVAVLFPQATVYIYFLFPLKIRTAAYIFGAISLYTIIERGSNYGGEACHLAGLVFGVWWATKGEAWWSRGAWRSSKLVGGRGRSKPAKRTVPRGGFAAKVQERRDDTETIDRILKKVYDGGIHSLTEREKQALQDATNRQQQREREAGRVDRL